MTATAQSPLSRLKDRPLAQISLPLLAMAMILALSTLAAFAIMDRLRTDTPAAETYLAEFETLADRTEAPGDFTAVIGQISDFAVSLAAYAPRAASNPGLDGLVCARNHEGDHAFWNIQSSPGTGLSISPAPDMLKASQARLSEVCERLLGKL